MKIPLDFFLRLVQKLFKKYKLTELNKSIKAEFQTSDNPFVSEKEINKK